MRVFVTGDMGFSDRRLVTEHLNRLHTERPFTTLIHGNRVEADRLAFEWAVLAGVPVRTYALEFAKYGKAAYKVRNRQLISDRPDLVLSFQSEKSVGHLLRQAKRANLTVAIIMQESLRQEET
jgi:hypothetical protein